MKEYDLISIGTGSAMSVVDAMLQINPNHRVAVIDMGIKDCFDKVIVKADDLELIGAHIIGPHASIVIQEIINIMYTQQERTMRPILSAMHIHPALSEVVQRSVSSLMSPQQYHHLIAEHYGLSSD